MGYAKHIVIDGQFCLLVIGREKSVADYNFLSGKSGKELHYHSNLAYTVSFCVADTKKECLDWYLDRSQELDNVQTGKSLRPLIWAKEQIMHFITNVMPMQSTLYIEGTNDKRLRAYHRIVKDIKKLNPDVFEVGESDWITIDKGCITDA